MTGAISMIVSLVGVADLLFRIGSNAVCWMSQPNPTCLAVGTIHPPTTRE